MTPARRLLLLAFAALLCGTLAPAATAAPSSAGLRSSLDRELRDARALVLAADALHTEILALPAAEGGRREGFAPSGAQVDSLRRRYAAALRRVSARRARHRRLVAQTDALLRRTHGRAARARARRLSRAAHHLLAITNQTGATLADARDELGAARGATGQALLPALSLQSPGPIAVSLGDSYISGEAGRWAGNVKSVFSYKLIDALGPTAYYDNPSNTGELIPGCHRAKKAEIKFTSASINLACSGAQTTTMFEGTTFKPGIDFYSDSSGRQGQALMLQNVAASNNVRMVVLSIGGNNYNFAPIMKTCVTDFLLSTPLDSFYCSQDPKVTANFAPANVTKQTQAIGTAIGNVEKAMANAGYSPSQWTLVVQNYLAPLPPASQIRYPQSGYTRQTTGGCGLWNRDVNWALGTAFPAINSSVHSAATQSGYSNIALLDLRSIVSTHQLCQAGVNLLPLPFVPNWAAPGALAAAEWVNQIHTVTGELGPFELQESLHPDFFGQWALRNCLSLVYNGGTPQGGTCVRTGNGNGTTGPQIALQ